MVLGRNGTNWRRVALLAAIVLGSWAVTYGSSKLVRSWKNPKYSGERFHKILVIGMSEDPVVRADFEDDLSSRVTRNGLEAVPGNSILLRPESPHVDLDYLKGQIRDFKIDAVLVSRLVSVDNKTTYIPGDNYVLPYPYYNSFYRYYGTAYVQVYSPDYLRVDQTVRVETNLYSTTPPNEDLVWTGYSDTFNPRSADKAIESVAKLVVKSLEKESILVKSR